MDPLRPPHPAAPPYGAPPPHAAPPPHSARGPPPPRRGPGPMLSSAGVHHPHAMSAAQQQQVQNAAIQERELAKRRAKRPTDRNLPDGIEEVPGLEGGVGLYRQLRDVERRFDAAIMRKRLDIQDAVNRNVKNQKTLRIYVSNTAKDQPWQMSNRPLDENAFDFDTGQIPTFRVRIEGRLLDDPHDLASTDPDSDLDLQLPPSSSSSTATAPARPPPPKFSHFFESIVVELDRPKDLHPDGNIIEWRKTRPNTQPATTTAATAASSASALHNPTEFDSFEFERKGDENVQCTIRLTRQDSPDRFRLSPQLADLLDTREDTRAGIVMKIWEYVRAHDLQDPDERRWINCDGALRAIFRQERLYFPHIPELTLSHILPLEPIVIRYTVRTDVPQHFSPAVHDVAVSVDDPIRLRMAGILNSPAYAVMVREIAAVDEHLAVLVQAVAHAKMKREFWSAMARDPAGFVRRWVDSQKRDLDTLAGEGVGAAVEDEDVRRSRFFDRVEENVYLVLARQLQKQGQV